MNSCGTELIKAMMKPNAFTFALSHKRWDLPTPTYCPIEATRSTRTHTIAVKTFDGCVLGEKKKEKT